MKPSVGFHREVAHLPRITDEQAAAARLYVAGRAVDVTDARHLLDVLGLISVPRPRPANRTWSGQSHSTGRSS